MMTGLMAAVDAFFLLVRADCLHSAVPIRIAPAACMIVISGIADVMIAA